MGIGGSPIEMSYAGRIFAVSAGSDPGVKLGGYENEVEANGDGITARKIMKMTPWMVDGLDIELDPDREDQQFLQERADGTSFEVFTLTYPGNYVLQGRGCPTGEIKRSVQSGTASVSFSGPGKLTQQ